jgi:ribosome-associated protein
VTGFKKMNSKQLKELIIKLLEDKKAENIYTISLSDTSSMASYMIFASGRSTKNVGAIASYVADELKLVGLPRINLEGFSKSEWVLVDAGDVIVHLMHPEAREYYRLEELWEKRKGLTQ